MKTYDHQAILCIVNEGFSDLVMEAAKEAGAGGGTVLEARGTANGEAEKLFKIEIQPKKEMVLIIVPTEIKDDVLHSLYKRVGLNTAGQGIAFALPVDHVVGIRKDAAKPAAKDGKESEANQEEVKDNKEEKRAEENPDKNTDK